MIIIVIRKNGQIDHYSPKEDESYSEWLLCNIFEGAKIEHSIEIRREL